MSSKNILLSVSLKNVSDSVIIFTHIDGSIYIENCHRCLFLLRGKQVCIITNSKKAIDSYS